MALDLLLRIVNQMSVNTGVGTSQNSAAFDFSTALTTNPLADVESFAEGATFVVADVTDAPEVGALPIRLDLELSLDGGTTWRKATSITMAKAVKEVKSARFGLLDIVPEAAVIAGTDRAAAINLQARVVANYVTSAGTFVFSAYIAGPQHQPAFVN